MFLLLTAILLNLTWAQATEMGTPDEAKALNKKAVAAAKADRDKAFVAFADPKGSYQAKDLYVFCMDMHGVMLSHAKKPQLVGKNLLDFNKYGDLLFQDMIKVAKGKGSGWVNYKWPHPASEELKEKSTYIEAVNKEYFCGVGAYK
ncbi:MAG: histidine kinase [Gammaproteobacteria bacterium]|nr:histidine kinase [Gammaproteobacteria bacterium]